MTDINKQALEALDRLANRLNLMTPSFNTEGRSDIDRIRQALTQLSAWQPIETAPRDGTDIFVLQSSGRIQRVNWSNTDNSMFDAWVDFQDDNEDYVEEYFIGWLPVKSLIPVDVKGVE